MSRRAAPCMRAAPYRCDCRKMLMWPMVTGLASGTGFRGTEPTWSWFTLSAPARCRRSIDVGDLDHEGQAVARMRTVHRARLAAPRTARACRP